MVDISRRRAVAGAGLLGALGVAGVAGTTLLGGPDPGKATGYEKWLVAPASIPYPMGSYQIAATNTGAVAQAGETLPSDVVARYAGESWVPGVESFEAFDSIYGAADAVQVFDGGFDRQTVEQACKEASFLQRGSSDGYTHYEPRNDSVLSVGDDAIVYTSLRKINDAAIRTAAGDGERFQEINGNTARLLSQLGHGDVVRGAVDPEGDNLDKFGPLAAAGLRMDLGTETTDLRAVFVFESGERDDAVAAAWADGNAVSSGVEFAETTTDGRSVIATGSMPTGELNRFEPQFHDSLG